MTDEQRIRLICIAQGTLYQLELMDDDREAIREAVRLAGIADIRGGHVYRADTAAVSASAGAGSRGGEGAPVTHWAHPHEDRSYCGAALSQRQAGNATCAHDTTCIRCVKAAYQEVENELYLREAHVAAATGEAAQARTVAGFVNNCALNVGFPESECQMCNGNCPDREEFRVTDPDLLAKTPETSGGEAAPVAAGDLRELLGTYREACQRPSSSVDYVMRMSDTFEAWMQAVTDRLERNGR